MPRLLRSVALIGCLATGLLAIGCASRVELKTSVDPLEYESCPRFGGVVVTGSTFGRTKGGAIISAAGRAVHLDKGTRYAGAAYAAIQKKQAEEGFFVAESEFETVTFDPMMLKCRREAAVGLDGTFRFENVSQGTYYLSTYISWNAGRWVGTWSMSQILVMDGDHDRPVVLSGFHRVPR
jgi:hypothetical protein